MGRERQSRSLLFRIPTPRFVVTVCCNSGRYETHTKSAIAVKQPMQLSSMFISRVERQIASLEVPLCASVSWGLRGGLSQHRPFRTPATVPTTRSLTHLGVAWCFRLRAMLAPSHWLPRSGRTRRCFPTLGRRSHDLRVFTLVHSLSGKPPLVVAREQSRKQRSPAAACRTRQERKPSPRYGLRPDSVR
jgi:hypothetical protein